MKKIGVPLKTTDRKSKPGWELRLASKIKRLRQRIRILKRNIKKFSDETEKARQLELKKKFDETNQKIPAKEGRLKRTEIRPNNIDKTGCSKTKKIILPTIWRRMGEAISTTECERGKKILGQHMGTERS